MDLQHRAGRRPVGGHLVDHRLQVTWAELCELHPADARDDVEAYEGFVAVPGLRPNACSHVREPGALEVAGQRGRAFRRRVPVSTSQELRDSASRREPRTVRVILTRLPASSKPPDAWIVQEPTDRWGI